MKMLCTSRRIKKLDLILILVLLLLSVALFFIFGKIKKDGKTVVIKQDNKVVFSGELSSDKEIKLKHNTVVIKDGSAFMKCADCKNRICVNTGKISKSGETVVCLPNKVIIEIE